MSDPHAALALAAPSPTPLRRKKSPMMQSVRRRLQLLHNPWRLVFDGDFYVAPHGTLFQAPPLPAASGCY